MPTDHDRLFKELLTTFFVEFLELFLPEVLAYLDPTTIVFLDKEVFADIVGGEKLVADLVIKASFRGYKEAYFVIHLEHQAQDQSGFPGRMYRYFSRFHEKFSVPIYPIAVFSHGKLKREPDVYQVVFPDRRVLRFHFAVIQLSRLPWRRFMRNPNPVACALMARMRIPPKDRPRVKLECLRMLASLRIDYARTQLISSFLDNYLRLNDHEKVIFARQMSELNPEEETSVLKLTTSWKEEGLAQGLLKGLQVALHMRYGTAAAALLASLETRGDAAEMERVLEAIPDSADLKSLDSLLVKRAKPRKR